MFEDTQNAKYYYISEAQGTYSEWYEAVPNNSKLMPYEHNSLTESPHRKTSILKMGCLPLFSSTTA